MDESDNIADDAIWTISDRYLVVDRLGSGGMAELFRAKMFGAAGFEKEFTIKLIRRHLLEDEEFVEMFVNEAKLSVALYHTNIVQVFDFGQHDGRYYIVMEYVEGKDLLDILSRCVNLNIRVPIDIALFIVMEMLKGLEFAHKATDVTTGEPLSIIHRDISPSNILVSYSGHVKVGDFGVAKARLKNSLSRTGTLKGKVGYLSPEQVIGRTIDQRSDIFSAGIVLFEALSMTRLFRAESDFDTMVKVRDCNIEEALDRIPPLPKALRRIVLKALARHPDNRYDSAAAFFQDLASFCYAQRITAESSTVANFMRRLFTSEIKRQKKKRMAESDNLQWMNTHRKGTFSIPQPTATNLPEIPKTAFSEPSDGYFPTHSRDRQLNRNSPPHDLSTLQRSQSPVDRHSGQVHNSDVEAITSHETLYGSNRSPLRRRNSISHRDAPITSELPPTSSAYGRHGQVHRRNLELRILEKYRGQSFFYRNPEGNVFGPLPPDQFETFVKGASLGSLSFDGNEWISISDFAYRSSDSSPCDPAKTLSPFEKIPSAPKPPLPTPALTPTSEPIPNPKPNTPQPNTPKLTPPTATTQSADTPQSPEPKPLSNRLPRLGDNLHANRVPDVVIVPDSEPSVSHPLRASNRLDEPSSTAISPSSPSSSNSVISKSTSIHTHDVSQATTLAENFTSNPDTTSPPLIQRNELGASSSAADPPPISTPIPVRSVNYSTRLRAHNGTLEQVSFTRLLHRIYRSQETGRLSLNNQDATKDAYFELGRPVAVTSNLEHERLGNLLLERQLITAEQLQTALDRTEKWGGRVGDALVANGVIPAYQIVDHLRMQFEGKLLEVFTWHGGSYQYYENQVTDERTYSIGVDLARLISKGCFNHVPRRVILATFEGRTNQHITLKNAHDFGLDDFMLSTRAVRIIRMISPGDTIDTIQGRVPPIDADFSLRVLYLLHQVEFLTFETTKPIDSPGFSFESKDSD